ncbi:hypothetical protein [Streptomyces hydrogenans]|uniref:hypothetical protein n=1 Tax=Streptomyces hydrogenans TaxID=1873719 RepID=UPI00332DD384
MNPDDCPPCRAVFGALVERQMADPETPLVTEEIGRLVGLKKRATQVHLAHLFAHGHIDADRRTPLHGMSQPILFGAQEWAASVVAPDPTCAKCLIALAGIGWEGQIHQKDLAELVGIGLRTVQTHRAHLVAADLVSFRPTTVREGTRNRGKLPDRFTLLSATTAPPLEGAALEAVPAVAAGIVDRIRWFVGVSDEERTNAIQSVAWVLRNGWPEEAILRALDASENRHAYRPGGYLSKLLSKLPRQYIVPARQMVTQRTEPRRLDCAVCDTPFKTTMPGHVLCGGAICLRPDEAVIPPSATIYQLA